MINYQQLRSFLYIVCIALTFSAVSAFGQKTLSVPSKSGEPGDQVTVTVNLNDGDGIGGIQFNLNYNHSVLSVVDADSDANLNEEVKRGSLLTDHQLIVNASNPGTFAVVVSGTSSLNSGSGTVISVAMRINPSASSQSTSLSLSNVVASDPIGNQVSVSLQNGSVQVNAPPPNQPPVANNDSVSTPEDQSIDINVLGNDSDPENDTLTVTQVTQPSHGSTSIVSGNQVRYIPQSNYHGSDSFAYTISDGSGNIDSATVNVTVQPVNDSPVAANDSATTAEDQAVTIQVLANDSDPNGDTLTIVSVSSPAHGSSLISGSAVQYTPAPNYNGSDSFSYTISDGKGGTDAATVSVTVTPVNDPPNAVNDSATTQQGKAVTISVLNNDSDVDNDTLTVTQTSNPPNGSATINSSGAITYTPDPSYFGSDSFSYTISDGKSGTDTATVSVTVTEVNDPPVAANDSATTAEDQAVTIQVLANDSDPNGDTLTIVSVNQPSKGASQVSGDAIRYTPTRDFNGTDTFTYTVSDSKGAQDTAIVTVTVTPINDPPVAKNDTASTTQGESVNITVLLNDTDPDGDRLTLAITSQPENGVSSIDSGWIVYTPNPQFVGQDSLSYKITDPDGLSSSAVVTISVTGSNSNPVASNDSITTAEDTPVDIPVLNNDSDADGDTLEVVSVTQPSNGTTTLTAVSVHYQPSADFNGQDQFQYTISDGKNGSATATVTVSVTPVNEPPRAVDDSLKMRQGESIPLDVLANDSDPDGDPLTVVSVSQPGHGTATIVSGRSILYDPKPGFHGKDAFTYTVSDPSGATDTATVQVHVVKGGSPNKKLVFPLSINTGSSTLFSDTFVGVGLLNPMESTEEVSLQSLSSQGTITSNVQLGDSLPPGGQTAFLTTEAMGPAPGSLALIASGDLGSLRGFFMIGSNDLTKMDGIGSELEDGTDLYFTLAEQGDSESTLIFLFNSDSEASPELTIQLFTNDGTLVAETEAILAPEGSLMGTLEEIFHEGLTIESGYFRVQATGPIRGFEILARNQNFAAMSGRESTPASRLFSPHFFVDYTQEGSTQVRLLNTSQSVVTVEIALRDDHSDLLTKKTFSISAGQLLAEDLRDLLAEESGFTPAGVVTGFVDVQVISNIESGPASLLGSITFEGGANKSLTSLPLINTGSTRSLFPHVAQSKSAAIFTGFALLNPSSQEAEVTITVFDEEGGHRASKDLTIAPYSRHIDMLDGADFFGPEFEQVKGHVRIESSEAVITFAIVGDYHGQYLSAIEAQSLPAE